MATSRDSPNPLRPYYIAPSIGLPQTPPSNATTSAPARFSPSIGTSARDLLADLDYGDYLPEASPSVTDMAKRLMDQAVWNYTSVFLAQPFEVSKTILQCHLAVDHVSGLEKAPLSAVNKRRPSSMASGKYGEFPSDDDDSDADSPSYFTSTAPRTPGYASPTPIQTPDGRSRSRAGLDHEASPSPAARKPLPKKSATYRLDLKRNDSLFEVLAQLWAKESAWGIWKATNSTFVYNFLLKTMENWIRSLLSALLNVPDPGLGRSGTGGLDIVDSPSPLASLLVTVAAAGVAGFVLAPLDLVRTRLIITPTGTTPRAILPSLRSLPTITVPTELLPITFLHSMLPTFFSTSMPLFLRSNLHIDPILTPTSYSATTFLTSVGELFLRLPLETVLRRAQVSVLNANEDARVTELQRESYTSFRSSMVRPPANTDEDPAAFKTVVDIGPYKGILGSMWFIVREEGSSVVAPPVGAKALQAKNPLFRNKLRKGQGVHGLWRGWRVGFWGLVGVWTAEAFNGRAGGEF